MEILSVRFAPRGRPSAASFLFALCLLGNQSVARAGGAELTEGAARQPGLYPTMLVEVPPEDLHRLFVVGPAIGHAAPRRFNPQGRSVSVRDNMSPVKNQSSRGTCASFAAVALLEAGTQERYSEQCLAAANGQDAMSMAQAIRLLDNGYIFTAASCPYDERNRGNVPFDVHTHKNLVKMPRRSAFHRLPNADGRARSAVNIVRNLIDREKLPVAVGVYTVGAWWHSPSFVPRRVPARYEWTSLDGRPRPKEPGVPDEYIDFNPAERSQKFLATGYFYEHENKRLVRSGYAWSPERQMHKLDWQSVEQYVDGVRPLKPPSRDEVTASCTHVTKRPQDNGGVTESMHKCPAHAIVITGYDDRNEAFQFKNSWGPDWKQEGYGYMSYAYFDVYAMMRTDGDSFTFERRS